ncbi:uncharacterized protein LOC103568201 [Microplitis demolitor]|uniref:uncharacterized protein LOC103568201 n=1 Tax=Microplitis demolitor TaxID=69319 RepID=UPI0004CD6050|nr:uncharacterized protein LOC103568201 [Microplitis demolitor]
MDDEKLIKYVRTFRGLYDMSHSQYLNGNYKEKKWTEIADKLNQPVVACKARWNNIRDNFRKSLKKRIAQDEEKVTQSKKYKYEDQLDFLIPFIKIRDTDDILDNVVAINIDTIAHIKNDTEQTDDTDSNDYDYNDEYDDQDQMISTSKSTPPEKVPTIPSYHDDSYVDVPKQSLSSESSKKRKADDPLKFDNSEAASVTLMKYVLEQSEKTNQQSVHPVDAFLAGLAPTLKSLNPYHLNIAKSKIFNVVQELEMNQIMNVPAAFEPPVTKFFISPSSSPLHNNTPSSTFIPTAPADLHK